MIIRATLISIILFLILNPSIYGQNSEVADTTLYEINEVDQTPILITDEKEYEIRNLNEFFLINFQYPNTEEDCSGKIIVSFIIESDWKLTNKRIVKKLCDRFDENAMKVIDLMKTWKPAIKSEKPVRMKLVFPMNIMLQ